MRSPHYLGTLVALVASVSSTIIPSEDLSNNEITQITNTKQAVFGATVSSWCGCTLLSMLALGEVFWPGSNTYQLESTTKYWSTTTWNRPQCVFVPQTAKSVGKGIWAARLCGTDIAIRGGGHMPVGPDIPLMNRAQRLKAFLLSIYSTLCNYGPTNKQTA